MLLIHDTLYAHTVQCSLISFVSLIRMGFSFGFHLNSLGIFYNGNSFGQATLKGNFIVLDLDDTYNSTSSILFHNLILNMLNSMFDLAMWVKI